jgi:putative hydrolase of the HAD superfamily
MKKVLFDFGNVLGFFDHGVSCAKLAPLSDVPDQKVFKDLLFGDEHKEFERGRISPYEFFTQIVAKTGLRVSFAEFSHIYADVFSSIPGIEAVIALVPEESRFILSNTDPLHWRYIELLPIITKYFGRPQQTIRSFDAGARKPEIGIFTEGIQRTGVPLSEIIYFDDVPEYVETFRKLGGTAILFNAREQSPVVLWKHLEDFGVLNRK